MPKRRSSAQKGVIMSEIELQPRRLFTIDEANAMLPLVRAITSDLSSLAKELAERQRRLVGLRNQRKSSSGDVYSEELEQVETDLAKDVERMKEYLRELLELGVEPKCADEGLVDFPTRIDGRIVLLCWRLGESEVAHWHEIDAGFAGRQPLVAGSVAGADGSHQESGFGDA